MKRNKWILGIILMAFLVGTAVIATALGTTEPTRYDKLLQATTGFEARAQSDIVRPTKPPVVLKDNKDAIQSKIPDILKVKTKEQQQVNNLNDEKCVSDTVMTYRDFINSCAADLDLQISPDRMIRVVQIQYPNGYLHNRLGLIKNALVTTYYDAETGETLGNGIQAMNTAQDFIINRPSN